MDVSVLYFVFSCVSQFTFAQNFISFLELRLHLCTQRYELEKLHAPVAIISLALQEPLPLLEILSQLAEPVIPDEPARRARSGI